MMILLKYLDQSYPISAIQKLKSLIALLIIQAFGLIKRKPIKTNKCFNYLAQQINQEWYLMIQLKLLKNQYTIGTFANAVLYEKPILNVKGNFPWEFEK
jgi:hypothetical protein